MLAIMVTVTLGIFTTTIVIMIMVTLLMTMRAKLVLTIRMAMVKVMGVMILMIPMTLQAIRAIVARLMTRNASRREGITSVIAITKPIVVAIIIMIATIVT